MKTCPICGNEYKALTNHLKAHYRRSEFSSDDMPVSGFSVYWCNGFMSPGRMTWDEMREDLIELIGCSPESHFDYQWKELGA